MDTFLALLRSLDQFPSLAEPMRPTSWEVRVEKDSYKIELEVPGFGPDDLKVEQNGREILIKGEKNGRSVDKVYVLPTRPTEVRGTVQHGLLTIEAGRPEEELPKQIKLTWPNT